MTKLFDALKIHFTYDNGLYWVKPTANRVKQGDRFGHIHSSGHRRGVFLCDRYYEHKLVWLYHYGVWPKELDHINRIRDDNRIENLREVTRQQNNFNKCSYKNSSSKYKGVSWYKNNSKWKAQYVINSKTFHIGYFDDELEAAKAYDNTVREVQKEYGKYNV